MTHLPKNMVQTLKLTSEVALGLSQVPTLELFVTNGPEMNQGSFTEWMQIWVEGVWVKCIFGSALGSACAPSIINQNCWNPF